MYCAESWTPVCHWYGEAHIRIVAWSASLSLKHNTVLPHWHCFYFNVYFESMWAVFKLPINHNFNIFGETLFAKDDSSSCQRCQDGRSAAEHLPGAGENSAPCSPSSEPEKGHSVSGSVALWPFQLVTQFVLFSGRKEISPKIILLNNSWVRMWKLNTLTWIVENLISIWKLWEYAYKVKWVKKKKSIVCHSILGIIFSLTCFQSVRNVDIIIDSLLQQSHHLKENKRFHCKKICSHL